MFRKIYIFLRISVYKLLTATDVIDLNKEFHNGKLVNQASLEFAISCQYKTKNWLEQLSYIIRSLLIDHVFEDANKRTAVAVILAYFKGHKLNYDPYRLDDLVILITKKNINDIKKLGRLIKNVIR